MTDTAAPILKLAHLMLAMALVAGLAGRWTMLDRAAKSRDLSRTETLIDAAGAFERTTTVVGIMVLKPF